MRMIYVEQSTNQQRKRLRRPVCQRQRLGFCERQRAVRVLGAAHGHPLCAAQHLSVEYPGLDDLVRAAPGGSLFPAPTKPMPKSKFREDITVVGVPLTAICNREYTDPRQRQLFKNIIYVGALPPLRDHGLNGVRELTGGA